MVLYRLQYSVVYSSIILYRTVLPPPMTPGAPGRRGPGAHTQNDHSDYRPCAPGRMKSNTVIRIAIKKNTSFFLLLVCVHSKLSTTSSRPHILFLRRRGEVGSVHVCPLQLHAMPICIESGNPVHGGQLAPPSA